MLILEDFLGDGLALADVIIVKFGRVYGFCVLLFFGTLVKPGTPDLGGILFSTP